MDAKTAFSSGSGPREASNNDELLMQQTLIFSDTLKDLKDLRKQLYSAAEYFEASYHKRPQKEVVLETLKEYAIKALISTVDHLGSVASKLNGVFDEKIGDASALELQFSCLEKRVETCQDYINQRGISQHSLAIQFPKHHKRYIFPVEEQPDGSNQTDSCNLRRNDFKNAVVTAIRGTPSQIIRGRSPSESPQLVTQQGSFSFSRSSEKRTTPSPLGFPFLRSGSLKRSSSPNYVGDKAQVSSRLGQWAQGSFSFRLKDKTFDTFQYRSEPRRAVSSVGHPRRGKATNTQLYAGKSKRLFKALMSMHKARNDSSIYKLLDEA